GAVHGDDGGAAKAEVVLEGDACFGDLANVAHSAELPVKFGALCEAGGAQRMAFGDESAGWVDDPLAAVGDGAGVDEFAGFTFGAQAECFVGDEFVCREAVVEFDDVDVFGS